MVSREITTWLVLIGFIIAGVGLQLLWTHDSYSAIAPADGGTYVEGVVGQLDSLNPLYVSTNSESSVGRLIFSSLYNYDQQGSLHQDLATSMVIDPSNKTYTVTIRSDAKWHDGEPVTSKDIVFTLNLIKNPAVRSPLRINWTDVSVTAPTASSVKFTLPATYAAFPHALTFPIVPSHILSSVAPGSIRESTFSQSPIGSGPFKFKLFQQSDAVSQHRIVHLIANDAYYAGTPRLSRFELHAYPNEDAMLRALKVGELTGASDISPLSIDKLSKKDHIRTTAAKDSGLYLLLNMNNFILKDAKVRKALQMGTDTEAIRNAIGGGQEPLDLPVLSSQVSGTDVPQAPAYDLAKAAIMLDEAGWKTVGSTREKDGVKMEITLTTIKGGEYERIVDVVNKQWQKLGVTTRSRVVDTSSVASTFIQDTLQARNYDVLLYELAIGADPDVYAYWHSSQIGQTGYNFSSYSNKNADTNLSSARSRLEPELRKIKYKQFAKQWLDDVPAIGLYQPVMEYITNDNATAMKSGGNLPTASDRYANVLYWSVGRDTVYKTP